jgi:hypothetical protein
VLGLLAFMRLRHRRSSRVFREGVDRASPHRLPIND